MSAILIVLLILVAIGVFPIWPHSRAWGYRPSGGIGIVAIIVIILLLSGHI